MSFLAVSLTPYPRQHLRLLLNMFLLPSIRFFFTDPLLIDRFSSVSHLPHHCFIPLLLPLSNLSLIKWEGFYRLHSHYMSDA